MDLKQHQYLEFLHCMWIQIKWGSFKQSLEEKGKYTQWKLDSFNIVSCMNAITSACLRYS